MTEIIVFHKGKENDDEEKKIHKSIGICPCGRACVQSFTDAGVCCRNAECDGAD